MAVFRPVLTARLSEAPGGSTLPFLFSFTEVSQLGLLSSAPPSCTTLARETTLAATGPVAKGGWSLGEFFFTPDFVASCLLPNLAEAAVMTAGSVGGAGTAGSAVFPGAATGGLGLSASRFGNGPVGGEPPTFGVDVAASLLLTGASEAAVARARVPGASTGSRSLTGPSSLTGCAVRGGGPASSVIEGRCPTVGCGGVRGEGRVLVAGTGARFVLSCAARATALA